MKYRVVFYTDYIVDATNKEEALDKANYEMNEDIDSGRFTLDNEISMLGTSANKQPTKSVKNPINSEKNSNYESDRDRKKALRQSQSILAKYKKD